jgi:hypothetical protein
MDGEESIEESNGTALRKDEIITTNKLNGWSRENRRMSYLIGGN